MSNDMNGRIHTVTMPKWGMTMTEGKVAGWLKSEGDRVEPGDEFVEVETEKITNVVEAQSSGLLRRILVQPGQTAPVGAPIALLADDDVTEEELDAVAQAAASAEAAGGGLAARRVGPTNVVTAGEGREGVPLVLVHGFSADAATWMFLHEDLAADRPVHAVELPSHGQSDIDPSKADLDGLAGAVRAALDEIAPGPLHLAGHSLGGRVSLRVAAELGDRLRSLTLVAPAGLGSSIGEDFPAAYLAADKRRPMKDALRMLVADEDSVTSEMVEGALAAKRMDGATEALAAIREQSLGERATEGVEGERAAVAAPVLLIWGAQDRVVPPPEEGAVLINGAGHLPHMEKVGQVAALMSRHIASAEGSEYVWTKAFGAPAMTGLPGLRGGEHIGLTVPDLDAAERFLVEVLGAQLVFDGGTIADEDVMVRVLGANRGDSTRYKFFRLGHGLNLEVFEYRTKDRGAHPGNHQAGGHHLALYVDEIGPAVEHLRAHGIPVDEPEYIETGPAAGSHWVYFKAPWGLQMELVSYPNGKGYEAGASVRLWNPRFPER